MKLYALLQVQLATSNLNLAIINLVYELPHEFPDNFKRQDLRKLGIIRKMSNLGGA